MSQDVKSTAYQLEDGIYPAVISEVETGVKSRFNDRNDLIRIGLDLLHQPNGLSPRIWFYSLPEMSERLSKLIVAALGVKPPEKMEVDPKDLKPLIGKEVNIVLAKVKVRRDTWVPRIITFLPIERS